MIPSTAKATPGVDVPDMTIDGFSEFAFTMDTIRDPATEDKLRSLARRIVASHRTSDRIIGFEVHGHADVTLRVAPGLERDRTEFEVSRDRAENAKDTLLRMIQEQGGGPIMGGIRANSSARGLGAKYTLFRPATNEEQRKKNRRVEIFLKSFRPQPVPQVSRTKTLRLWLNAFIDKDVKNADGTPMSFVMATGPHSGESAIPGPFNGKVPGFDDCYLTDQRTFDAFKSASSRIHAEVVIDFTGPSPVLNTIPPLGATVDTVRLRVSTGEVLNQKRGVARGGFSPVAGFVKGSDEVEVRFAIAGSNPVAKMPKTIGVPFPPFVLPEPVAPSPSDPPALLDPDIDMLGSFSFDAQTRKLRFRAVIDGFPFYEGYASADGNPPVTIFRKAPEPGRSPASGLPGLPNRAVEVDLSIP